MALVLADRVLETTTTTGSGTITLAGAEPGYQSFSAVGNGNQTYYTITADTVWEVGIGTYTASGTTLSRDTVLSSSASGAKVTLPSGVKKVFVTYPSEKSVNLDVSGNISLSSAVISGVGYPSTDSDAATKLYVDTLAAEGISYHTPVKYEVPNTTGNLTATYNNGTAGVSATLTNAGTLGPFVPDGVTASISDRILIYNQTNGYENGVYTVTTVGTGASSWVLTRAADANTYGVKSPTALGTGDAFYVTSGNTGAGETYVCNTPGTIVFGSTNITFVQVSAAQVYQAGTGISLTNTTISLVSPVVVATGGTGLTSTPTNGQLLIGNGSGYTLSTLTAGSGVSITNSAGSITLTATGTGGTVVAVTATAPLASTGGVSPNISIANSTGTGSVVLDQGATISSATITAGVSAAITTITGTSANITTVTGTTAGFSSAAITQLSGTSAGITTVSGTTTTFSSGTITQFGATSATITTLSGTNVTYPNANFTSASITNLALTSITLSNLSVSSANITTLTGTNHSCASATITTGNLTFSSTAQRITGDFSNATASNRLLFQTSTTNGNSFVGNMPNGTGSYGAYISYNGSDPANSSSFLQGITSTDARLVSTAAGTGSLLPLTFYTGGSERMRLDTSGNLGIGTASPLARLDLGTSTGQKLLTYGSGNVRYGLSVETSEWRAFAPTGAVLTFGNMSTSDGATFTERMRLDTSGNLGIGTSTANKSSSSTALTVNTGTAANYSAVEWSSNNTLNYHINANDSAIYHVAAGTRPWIVYTNGTERLRIDSSGNVGIGTASPSNFGGVNLQVQNSTVGSILWSNGTITGQLLASASAEVTVGSRSNHPLRFGTNDTERMRIDTSGNVGIGTASPAAPLQVVGAGRFGASPSQTTGACAIYNDGNNVTIEAFAGNNSATKRDIGLATYGGNVGIGTASPTANLEVGGSGNKTLRVGTTSNAYAYLNLNTWALDRAQLRAEAANPSAGSGTGAGKLTIWTANAGSLVERMAIDGDGNVGINNTAPAARLHVIAPNTTAASLTWNATSGQIFRNENSEFAFGLSSSSPYPLYIQGRTSSSTARDISINPVGGNVGIGRAPSVTLDVNGPIYSRYTATWGAAVLYMPGGYSQFGKESGYRADIVNVGGLDANSPFWIGYHWCPPDVITNSSAQNSFPRTSFYFNYSTVTNPSNMTWNMYTGNNNGVPISWQVGTESAGSFNIVTSGNERVRIPSGGGLSVGTTASPGAGAIFATGNITAYYSDARLKDFKGKIDGALDKISQLNGYYYTENAKAEEFGYNNKTMQVGVSAQEVQAVLPEVVSTAPFDMDENNQSKSGENYMTVNYEKLVPLLIEAIKELKAEVEALKASKS